MIKMKKVLKEFFRIVFSKKIVIIIPIVIFIILMSFVMLLEDPTVPYEFEKKYYNKNNKK